MKIAIAGGGVAGLFTAWYLRQAGQEVHLFEKDECGKACSWDAAGMLAPVNELEFQELPLLKAGVASRRLYDGLEKDLGDIGLDRSGTLEVGLTADDRGYLRRLFEFQRTHGLDVEWLEGASIQEHEPYASRHLPFAIWSPEDIQVDNRKLVENLAKENLARGVNIFEKEEFEGWEVKENGEVDVRTEHRKESYDALVLACGVASFSGADLPFSIYPVRGEMVSLNQPSEPFLKKTIRVRNQTLGSAYVVPKEGRLLCGSTSEEQGFDARNTAGGLLDILRKCYAAVPGIYELPVQETWAGLRPATLNRLPIIDQEAGRPIFHLNGLYRHGILLGPLAGKAMAKLILEGKRLPETASFRIS